MPTPDEAARLEQIDRAAFTTIEGRWTAQDFLDLGGPPRAALMADHEVRKACLAIRFAADEAEIVTLGVAPSARRRGLGAALLSAGMDLARSLDIRAMFLEVAVDNTAAIALYLGAGFAEVGRRPDYYLTPDGGRVDALILRKAL